MVCIQARTIFCESQEFRLNAVMRFNHFTSAFEDESLRRMKPGKIGSATGVFREIRPKHDGCPIQMFHRFVEEATGLGFHNSRPSCLI